MNETINNSPKGRRSKASSKRPRRNVTVASSDYDGDAADERLDGSVFAQMNHHLSEEQQDEDLESKQLASSIIDLTHCEEEREEEESKQPAARKTDNDNVVPELVLAWNLAAPHIPLAAEQDMLKVILRWGAKERGMLKSQPAFRLRDIQRGCKRNGMHISQACSLRRHHMSRLNPTKSKVALQLGTNEQIRQSADFFEQAIAAFLQSRGM